MAIIGSEETLGSSNRTTDPQGKLLEDATIRTVPYSSSGYDARVS